MACCSGSTQARNLIAQLYWRFDPEVQLHIKVDLVGQDGKWAGTNSGTFNFGDLQPSCGKLPGLGLRKVFVRIELQCTELPDGTAVIGGTVETIIGPNRYSSKLKNVSLECLNGGPKCVAVWPFLWVVGLGTANLNVIGK